MLRHLLLALALFVPALAGCIDPADDPDDDSDFDDYKNDSCPLREGDYGRYDDAHVMVLSPQGALTLSIKGSKRGGHCPPAFLGTARVNGVAMIQTKGGGAKCPNGDIDQEYCLPLTYALDGKLLPPGRMLDITFDPAGPHDESDYAAAHAWRVTVDWTSQRVWLADDLAARVRADEAFQVRWTPEDAPAPRLTLSVLAQGSWEDKGLGADRQSSEPGAGVYRFRGAEPAQVWTLKTTRILSDDNLRCEGFERCSVEGSHDYELQPAGIAPESPDGVAPPRACIALPGGDGSEHSAAPYWLGFPDLSMLQVSNMSCDGADLYFVLLGACGACGGGKSTYVVGNRGSRAARFSVKSNLQTSDSTVLEPQQLSEPFAIAFEGQLSALEILSADDCDPASNKAWVASIACDWPTWPPAPDWTPDGCNNTCGFPSDTLP